MSRRDKRAALRIPRRLVYSVLHVAVAGTLGCGEAAPARDAAADLAVTAAHDAAADLEGAPVDACALSVRCMPVVAGTNCSGIFCNLTDCPTGCEPYV